MTRTDTHKPSLLDPAEYTFMSAFYQGGSDAMMKSYCDGRPSEMDEYYAAVELHPSFEGNHASKNTCDHCGAAFAHGVLFLHIPSGELIHVGHICASNTVGLPSRAAAARKSAERAAAEENERIKRHEANAAWREANGDIIEYLDAQLQAEVAYRDSEKPNNLRGAHPFIADMIHTFAKWGNLSERQAAAVRKFIASAKERAENPKPVETEPTTPLIEGRRVITGTIVSTKWSEDKGFGSQPKMVVRDADGNKVFGTVAESMFTGGRDLNGMKGLTVEFTAAVERSRDDEHFGFYKRPTKMQEVAAA